MRELTVADSDTALAPVGAVSPRQSKTVYLNHCVSSLSRKHEIQTALNPGTRQVLVHRIGTVHRTARQRRQPRHAPQELTPCPPRHGPGVPPCADGSSAADRAHAVSASRLHAKGRGGAVVQWRTGRPLSGAVRTEAAKWIGV